MTKLFTRTFPAGSARLPIYLAGLSHFTLELCHNFMPVLYPILTTRMGLSFTQIGLLALANNLVTSTFQPILSFLPERYGAERVAALSILWLGLLMGLVGFAPNFLSLCILVAVASLGSAAYHTAGVLSVTGALISGGAGMRRGSAMSIFSVGGSLGSACSPTWILLWVGALEIQSSLMVMPVAVLMGLLLYQQVQQPNKPHVVAGPQQSTGQAQNRYLFGLILIVLGTMARAWFQVSLTTYLPAWIQSSGGSLEQGGQLLSVLLFATGAGGLLGGIIADRLGVWRVVMLSNLILAPAYWFWLTATPFLQVLLLIGIGIGIGANFSTGILLAHDALPDRIGLASGLVMGLGWIPAGLGASFTGYLADQSSLTLAMTTLVIPVLLAAICVALYRVGGKRVEN